MTVTGWESQDALDQIYQGLARARGSVRRQRDEGLPNDPEAVGRARQRVDWVSSALQTLPPQAAAPWDHLAEFSDRTPVPHPPLRLGTTRIGLGSNGVADLPVVLPLLGAGHVLINPAPGILGPLGQLCFSELTQVVDTLVLRALATTTPGSLIVIGDGWLPRFLDREDAYSHGVCFDIDLDDPAQVDNLLGRLRDNIDQMARTGPDKYRLLVLSQLDRLSVHQQEEFHWLLQVGPAHGIHALIIDSRVPSTVPVEYIELAPQRIRTAVAGSLIEVRPDGLPLPGSAAANALDIRITGGGPTALHLQPAQLWHGRSDRELQATVGDIGGRPEVIRLGDTPTHALIAGQTGSGKTNFLYALIVGLATNYSPDELELYLLDFKESVSFTSFAPTPHDPSSLPHARLIGLHINADREFGLAMLRDLHRQLGERAQAVKAHGVVDLRGLRTADPHGRWPRIVAVIDEFQILLATPDRITAEAVDLLEDLARRGRSFGIHLVLSSQEIAGIQALWGRPALVAQLTLRVALANAQKVLADDNDAAARIPQYHAVINSRSGNRDGNRLTRIPHFDEPVLRAVQEELCRRTTDTSRLVVFDGSVVPRLADAATYQALEPREPRDWQILLGRAFTLADEAACARIGAGTARNLAVIGTRPDEVLGVLSAAVRSVARQARPGAARFTVVAGGSDAEPAVAASIASGLTGHQVEVVGRDQIPAFVEALSAESDRLVSGGGGTPHFVVFAGVDAAAALLRKPRDSGSTGHEQLRRILLDSAETGIHLFGWWRSVNRLKDDLSDYDARLDEQIGIWVALDAQGNDLGALVGGDLVEWSPRPRRALWFDRAVHDRPQPMIPFGGDR